jgi:choline-phosphate cytidylyltransferase
MSSPSSPGSHAGKRKRTIPKTTVLDTLQPSSRDASGEDGESTAAESVNLKENIGTEGRPSAKRIRSGTLGNSTNGTDNAQDPGEPSDTTEGSTDIVNRVAKKNRKSVTIEEDEKTESMAPPPIGKLTDPVGYKTNPPPAGRAVRVYADGVFDLFHLGYILNIKENDI